MVHLHLDFSSPIEVSLLLKFDAKNNFALLDAITKVKGAYLQPASSGLRVSEGLDSPKILVEIPAELPRWDSIYRRVILSRFRRSGYPKKEAGRAADEYIARMREFWMRGFRKGWRVKKDCE